jgi:hypothetical protein
MPERPVWQIARYWQIGPSCSALPAEQDCGLGSEKGPCSGWICFGCGLGNSAVKTPGLPCEAAADASEPAGMHARPDVYAARATHRHPSMRENFGIPS